MLVRFYFESKEKRFLNNAFKQYISPELIDEMLNNEIMNFFKCRLFPRPKSQAVSKTVRIKFKVEKRS